MSKQRIKVNIGDSFGKWKVLKETIPTTVTKRNFLCECICGSTKSVRLDHLRGGLSKGCQFCKVKTHGFSYRKEYRSYADAKNRCTNKKDKEYKNYGGRGIKFIFKTFEEFLICVGEKPFIGAEIDRIDNDGNYEKGNVRWVTKAENRGHTRRVKNYKLKNANRIIKNFIEVL